MQVVSRELAALLHWECPTAQFAILWLLYALISMNKDGSTAPQSLCLYFSHQGGRKGERVGVLVPMLCNK